MPRNRAQRYAARTLRIDIRNHCLQDARPRGWRFFNAEEPPVGQRHQHRIVIGRAAQHHAVDHRQFALDHRPVRKPAIEHDRQRRKVTLQSMHDVVAQPRDFAVFLRRQSLQHRIARMHDEHAAPRRRQGTDEIADQAVVVIGIKTDPMLDGNRQRHCIAHRFDAIRHQRRLRHQARTETALLHALGRTAAIEVDFVVAPAFAKFRRVRKLGGIASAQLQRHRMFRRIEVEMARHIAVDQRRRRHHFRVKPRVPGELAQEKPAMPVGPVHHGRNAKTVGQEFHSVGVLSGHWFVASGDPKDCIRCPARVGMLHPLGLPFARSVLGDLRNDHSDVTSP